MSIPKWKPNQKLVKLVAETVEDLVKAKGYATTPSYYDVELVLQALHLINRAMEVANESRRGRKRDTNEGSDGSQVT